MAKASRSKKQPAFDANELADLIYSPAVGTGVGSHLLGDNHPEGKSHTGTLVKASSVAATLLPFLSVRLPDPSITTQPTESHPESELPIGMAGIFEDTIENAHGTAPAPTEVTDGNDHRTHPESNLPLVVTHTQGVIAHEINDIETRPGGNLPTGTPVSEELSDEAAPDEIETKHTHDNETHPEGNLPLDVTHQEEVTGRANKTHPEGNLPIGSRVSERRSPSIADAVRIELTPGSEDHRHPEGELPIGRAHSESRPASVPETSVGKTEDVLARHPQGKLPIGSSRPVPSLPTGKADTLDGSLVGRQQKIRRAVVAQDGHSSGEQLLYLSLWNAARPESPDTRMISIGYNGMSSLCKLERSNCKKNVQSLIEKLALEVTKAHETASSIGTTYRIFSYGEILRRRKAAGLIWVIRTSGVRFVRPMGDSPTPPVRNSPTGSMSESPTGSVSNTPIPPVCETPTPLGKERKILERPSSSSAVIYEALSKFGSVDDDVLHRLTQSCRQSAPDCTDEEIIHFIREKGSMVRTGRISNPIGFLLTAVPKCFLGETFQLYRAEEQKRLEREADEAARVKKELEEWRQEQHRILLDPKVPEREKIMIRDWLGISSEQGAATAES
jgi:hypothetical protein